MYKKHVAKFLSVVTLMTALAVPVATQAHGKEADYYFKNGVNVEFNVHIGDVEITNMRNRNYCYGEMAIVYAMARESGCSVDYILHLREDRHMSWNRIGYRLGVNMSNVEYRAKKILRHSYMEEERSRINIIISNDDRDYHDRDYHEHWQNNRHHKDGYYSNH